MKKKDIPLNNDNKFNLPSEHFGGVISSEQENKRLGSA